MDDAVGAQGCQGCAIIVESTKKLIVGGEPGINA